MISCAIGANGWEELPGIYSALTWYHRDIKVVIPWELYAIIALEECFYHELLRTNSIQECGDIPLRFFENLLRLDRTRSRMLAEYHFYLLSWFHPRHQLSPLDMWRSALFLGLYPLAASTPLLGHAGCAQGRTPWRRHGVCRSRAQNGAVTYSPTQSRERFTGWAASWFHGACAPGYGPKRADRLPRRPAF